MKYAEHKAKWSGCTLCPLYKERTMVVLARGKIPSPILFIGEAPGDSEDVIGKPFVGPAGQLLDSIIEQAIDGQYDYAMTNLVACIPKFDGDKGEPEKEHIESCRERLLEFIAMAKPRLIINVGALATKEYPKIKAVSALNWTIQFASITHPSAILQMRGRGRATSIPLEIKRAVATIREAIEDLE